jgi:predicted small lipoprotein YifL
MSKKRITISTYCLGAVIIVLVLAGCGRKGDLYLPENVKSENTKPDSEKTNNEKKESTQAPNVEER